MNNSIDDKNNGGKMSDWMDYDQLPVSKIQSLDAEACLSTILAEKMEYLESMLWE